MQTIKLCQTARLLGIALVVITRLMIKVYRPQKVVVGQMQKPLVKLVVMTLLIAMARVSSCKVFAMKYIFPVSLFCLFLFALCLMAGSFAYYLLFVLKGFVGMTPDPYTMAKVLEMGFISVTGLFAFFIAMTPEKNPPI